MRVNGLCKRITVFSGSQNRAKIGDPIKVAEVILSSGLEAKADNPLRSMRHATARTFTNLLRTQTRAGKIVGSFQRGGAAARGKITRSKKQDVGDFYKAVAHASARRQNCYALQLGEAQLLEARSKKIWLFTSFGVP